MQIYFFEDLILSQHNIPFQISFNLIYLEIPFQLLDF